MSINGSYSIDTLSVLMGEKKAFINNKGEIDVGKIVEITVDEAGYILKVVIQGAKKATVTMDQIYETIELALEAAITHTEAHISDLKNNVAAMRGRIQNIREED